jgi:hypothetical protein
MLAHEEDLGGEELWGANAAALVHTHNMHAGTDSPLLLLLFCPVCSRTWMTCLRMRTWVVRSLGGAGCQMQQRTTETRAHRHSLSHYFIALYFCLQEDMDDMLAHEEDLGGEELGGANAAAHYRDPCTQALPLTLLHCVIFLLAGGHG